MQNNKRITVKIISSIALFVIVVLTVYNSYFLVKSFKKVHAQHATIISRLNAEQHNLTNIIKVVNLHNERLNNIIIQQKKLSARMEKIDLYQTNIETKMDSIFRAFIAEKVESLTKDKTSDEEKVIALAKWVSANICNKFSGADRLSDNRVERVIGDDSKPVIKNIKNPLYLYFANRSGMCAA